MGHKNLGILVAGAAAVLALAGVSAAVASGDKTVADPARSTTPPTTPTPTTDSGPGGGETVSVTITARPAPTPADGRPFPEEDAEGARAASGVNARGESYGSDLHSTSEADTPDLIAAVATNGANGYLRNSELMAADPAPTSLDEPIPTPTVDWLPVYRSDGVTVIGYFDVGQ